MVAPMEDSMEALLDLLLRPLLPRKMLPYPKPSSSQQQAVAKQMHAIVILYNYYYRKQCPQLEFLSFETLCKAAVISNEPLVAYLDKTRSNKNNFSLVEKYIMQACNISVALTDHDLSKIVMWPIQTVAVFLADAKRENCFLKKDTLVKGVFSLVEKEVEGQKAEDVHEQIALSEVESVTGMQISVGMVRSAYQLVL